MRAKERAAWTAVLGSRPYEFDGQVMARCAGRVGPGPLAMMHKARGMVLGPWALLLAASQGPRATLIGHQRWRVGPRTVDFTRLIPKARMKLLTILSTHPSTKARSQGAGGGLFRGWGAPTVHGSETNGPSNPRPRSLRA